MVPTGHAQPRDVDANLGRGIPLELRLCEPVAGWNNEANLGVSIHRQKFQSSFITKGWLFTAVGSFRNSRSLPKNSAKELLSTAGRSTVST